MPEQDSISTWFVVSGKRWRCPTKGAGTSLSDHPPTSPQGGGNSDTGRSSVPGTSEKISEVRTTGGGIWEDRIGGLPGREGYSRCPDIRVTSRVLSGVCVTKKN